MVEVSEKVGIKTCAVITNMDHPIGNMVGNSLEIIETVECLQGRGPEDLMELVVTQGFFYFYLSMFKDCVLFEPVHNQTLPNEDLIE